MAVLSTRFASAPAGILLVGVNHSTAPIELREALHFTPEDSRRFAKELKQGGFFQEIVVLSTCNRSEVYGVFQGEEERAASRLQGLFAHFHGTPLERNAGWLYQRQNTDAIAHLFRVSAGLDSMLIGEAEILGQVRDAYLLAFQEGVTGTVLNRLFQAAIEVGKRVRAETEIGARPMSVALAAIKLAEHVFGDLSRHCALVLGGGAMAEQAVDHLGHRRLRRILVANRTDAKAIALANRVDGEALEWRALQSGLESADIVISSVGTEEPILRKLDVEAAMRRRSNRPVFLIDLGMPRSIEPSVGDLYNVYRYDLDELTTIVEQNRKSRENEIPRVQALVDLHVQKFQAWQTAAETLALLRELRNRLEQERDEFLQERHREVESLPHDQRQQLIGLTEELVARVMIAREHKLPDARELRARWEEIESLRQSFGLGKENV